MSGGHYDYPAIRIEMMAEQMEQEGRDEQEIAVVKACGEYLKALDYRESGDAGQEAVLVCETFLLEALLGIDADRRIKAAGIDTEDENE